MAPSAVKNSALNDVSRKTYPKTTLKQFFKVYVFNKKQYVTSLILYTVKTNKC